MQVKIFKPIKNPMQSGLQKDKWIMEAIVKDHTKSKYSLSGWTSSDDMSNEIRLTFPTKEIAIKYAEDNLFDYKIIEPIGTKISKRSYAQNFTKIPR